MDRQPIEDRTCGSCMMCCKLPRIPSLNKPAGIWCGVARSGQGCTKYNERPNECRTFFCQWMLDASLGLEWKPSVAKFITFMHSESGNFIILPDKGYPKNWKSPLYYSRLKETAARLLEYGCMTIVASGTDFTVILPDRDETVRTKSEENVTLKMTQTPDGVRYEVTMV